LYLTYGTTLVYLVPLTDWLADCLFHKQTRKHTRPNIMHVSLRDASRRVICCRPNRPWNLSRDHCRPNSSLRKEVRDWEPKLLCCRLHTMMTGLTDGPVCLPAHEAESIADGQLTNRRQALRQRDVIDRQVIRGVWISFPSEYTIWFCRLKKATESSNCSL